MATKTLKKLDDTNFSVVLPAQIAPTTKMLKLVEDPCFGKKYEQVEQCSACWIKQSCLVAFRNRKDQ